MRRRPRRMPCAYGRSSSAPSLAGSWPRGSLGDSSDAVVRDESWDSLTSWLVPASALFYCCRRPPSHRAGGHLRLRGSCLASWPSCYSHHPVASGTKGTLALQPQRGPGREPALGPPGLYQAVATSTTGGSSSGEFMTMFPFPSESWEETVACLPPSSPKTCVTLSPHPRQPRLETQPPSPPQFTCLHCPAQGPQFLWLLYIFF